MIASNDTRPLVLGQIGGGYRGPNLLRNFYALPGCTVKYVVDSSAERRRFVESNFPFSQAIEKHQTVLEDSDIDGVVIATPAASHFCLAKQVLEAGKQVFMEKPWRQEFRRSMSFRDGPANNTLL